MVTLPPNFQKVILSPGSSGPPRPPYPSGTKAVFHFRTETREGVVLDDSRTHPRPMELLLGKQFKLEAWELLLQTMALREVASLTLPPHEAVAYPMVAKAVRDSHKGEEHKKEEHHCCGMLQGGLGYADLDDLLRAPRPLTFFFELLELHLPGSFEREAWQLTHEEKAASIPALQAKGNDLFARGDVPAARAAYFEAVARIEQLSLREQPGSPEALAFEGQKTPLLLNYALCLMKEGELHEALVHLNSALALDPRNVKGLFRRGRVQRLLGNWKESRDDLRRAEELDGSLRGTVGRELELVGAEERAAEKEEKKRLSRLFE